MPYIILILLFPFCKRFLSRRKASITTDFFWVFALWTFSAYCYQDIINLPIIRNFSCTDMWWQFFWVFHLAPSFLTGALIGKYDLFSEFWKLFTSNSMRIIVAIGMLVSAFILRVTNGNVSELQLPEFLYAALFVVGSVTVIKELPIANRILIEIGKKSTYMWLLHGAIIYWFIPRLPKLWGGHFSCL